MREHSSHETVPSLRDEVHFQITGPTNAPVLVLGNSLATDMSLWRDQIRV